MASIHERLDYSLSSSFLLLIFLTLFSFSPFNPYIILNDWWLVKSQNHFQGNRLAVSGISSRKEEAAHIFVSAPIIKRYDVFSLETADGIYVITRGFINEKRTLENGFTPQILKGFLYGFPPNWESYALECIKEESEVGIDSANAVPENVSSICQEILSDSKYFGEENSIPTPLVFHEEAPGKCKKPSAADKCEVSKEIGEVDVAYRSDGNRRCTRLYNNKVCQQKQQQPVSGGLLKHLDIEQSSTSMEVENRDSDTAVSNNVSANLPEISPDAVEKSFPTSFVSPEKATGDCKKSLLEDDHDKSIKMSEVNVVHGSGGNRRSVRLHNIKLSQKKQPATEGPPKYPNEHQISPSEALEKSDGGHESPSTPVQSQLKGPVNALSEQVTNKFASRVFKATPAKTEGCYKKKRVTIIKSASSVKSSHERNVSHLNKGSKRTLSVVSPESLSLKKSRSGRLLLPPLEFWRNQIPIYNVDHEITEIQEGSSLISPFRGSSPSLGRSAENMRGGKMIVMRKMQKL
ncbi:hypothetical protein QL285_002636 [Trifolium repens]|nr:hypothetical protein QL285_002636 [Trifolium repens]